ncbi:hypothetical protein L9F63_007245, partial [Diploptera punctata]
YLYIIRLNLGNVSYKTDSLNLIFLIKLIVFMVYIYIYEVNCHSVFTVLVFVFIDTGIYSVMSLVKTISGYLSHLIDLDSGYQFLSSQGLLSCLVILVNAYLLN